MRNIGRLLNKVLLESVRKNISLKNVLGNPEFPLKLLDDGRLTFIKHFLSGTWSGILFLPIRYEAITKR